MSRLIAVLPDIGFPHQHRGALIAFGRFCASLRPSIVIQAGRLFASPIPSLPDLDQAADWIRSLGHRSRLVVVADRPRLRSVSEVIRIAGAIDAIAVETEYRLDVGWTVHADTATSHGRFPGATAIALAHQNRTNVICGHTGMRGIVNEIRETDNGPVELWGLEAGHLHGRTAGGDGLGFGVLVIDSGHRVRPTVVRVNRRGVFSYGGARFRP